MLELLFTSSGQLLEGGSELARFTDDGRLFVGDREYSIVHRRRWGWRYAVVERTSQRIVCEFHPSRIGRGGRLVLGASSVKLRGLPLRPRRWVFVAENGDRIGASSAPRSGRSWADVRLRSEASLLPMPEAPLTLAFGCWLILQWHIAAVPAGGGTFGG